MIPAGMRKRLANTARAPLARQSFTNLVVKLASIPVALAVSAMLARMLDVTEFGIYGAALGVFMVFAMPVIGGLSSLVIREINAADASAQAGRTAGAIAFSLLCIAIATFVYLLALGAFPYAPLRHGFTAMHRALSATTWMYPAFLVLALAGALMRGLHHVSLGTLPEQVIRQLTFLLLLAATAWCCAPPLDARGAFALQTWAMLLAALVSVLLLTRVVGREILATRPVVAWSRWLPSMGPFLLLGVVQVANSQLPMIVLGGLDRATGAAYYRVSDQLSGLALLPLMAVNLAFGPLAARVRSSGDRAALQASLTSANKLICALTLPALALLTLVPGPVLVLLFGEPYRTAAPILVILCAGTAYSAIVGPVGLTLNMLGHERATLRGMRVALLVNVVLVLALVPLLGGIGAALSATATKIVWNTLLFRKLHHLEGYSTLPFIVRPRFPAA